VTHPLVRDVLLLDGSTLRLRTPTPDDLDEIKRFYDELSEESRHLRFHGYLRTDVAARAYAEANGIDRFALIGGQGDRILAAASYDLLREPGAAEVAFAVADDFRERGTATRMLEQLAAVAAERGVKRFDAEVLAMNRAMIAVFEHAGFEVRRKSEFGEVTVSLDITPSEAVLERIDERDHIGAVASLRPLLAPRSIAVVGPSSAPGDLGAAVLASIMSSGFRGIATPVNANGEIVHSVRCVRSLLDLDEVPELVIVTVVPEEVPVIAQQAATVGAKVLLVVTRDPEEDHGATTAFTEELLDIARSGGLRVVGPRSLGVLNTDPQVALDATFANVPVVPGHLAIGSPSGAIGIGLLGHAAARRLGVSSFVALGDRVDVSTNDLLELWEEDEATAAVMLYVDTFGHPERFARIAKRVSRRKPILAVKGRRAAEAVRHEAQSHTAAALRGDAVVDAMFKQAGILRFRSGDELFSAASFFESQPLPLGRRITIISNSSGVATLAADACATRGLMLSDGINPRVLGARAGPSEFASTLRETLADPGVDAAMVHYIDMYGGDPEEVLACVSELAARAGKPVVASVLGKDGRPPTSGPDIVPNFRFPETCATVLARAAERREWLSRPLGQRPAYDDLELETARDIVTARLELQDDRADAWLTTSDAETLLASHGIPFVTSVPAATVEEAVAAAADLGGPVALKADFPPPAHAADIDAILLGLEGEEGIEAGWRALEYRVRLAGRGWAGALVQPLIAPGADVLVGAITDPDLGPVVGIGLGGRQAGLGQTAAFGVLPATDVEADDLIDEAESVGRQLEGFRGSAKLDRTALRDLILRFALLLRNVPELAEADLNPVRCMRAGCVVLDARLRVGLHRVPERVKTW
jgi:acyl-CoA synthetase (NDP forming)/RimJ/RimL family protein N-acetyltransferase